MRADILPGKRINLFFSLSYLSLLLVIPLAFLIFSLQGTTFEEFWKIITTERSLDAIRLSFTMAVLASCIALFFGLIIAWVLTKYKFPGIQLFDSIVDLPFAMPTAVSGIALAAIYSEQGWMGKLLAPLGFEIAFTRIGILIALVFICLPFAVRAIQPAIEALDFKMEEAAASLGAGRLSILTKIVLPQLFPSLITGFTMSFSRALGEYGSVIFIAGNVPYLSEILPLLIVVKLEQFDYRGATVLAVGMLAISFLSLVVLSLVGNWMKRRYG